MYSVCTVHYNRAPVISATPHVWNQNSLVVQIMFISSHEIEHSFSNEAQRLVYQRLRRRTKRRLRDTRSVADSHLVHSSALISSSLLPLLSQLSKIIILVPLTFFLAHTVNYAQRWWHLTMTNFYRRLSNCQPHHAVHISEVSTTVLTTTTTHNTALEKTVPNAPHFLCRAKVSAHVCLPLMYITLDW